MLTDKREHKVQEFFLGVTIEAASSRPPLAHTGQFQVFQTPELAGKTLAAVLTRDGYEHAISVLSGAGGRLDNRQSFIATIGKNDTWAVVVYPRIESLRRSGVRFPARALGPAASKLPVVYCGSAGSRHAAVSHSEINKYTYEEAVVVAESIFFLTQLADVG